MNTNSATTTAETTLPTMQPRFNVERSEDQTVVQVALPGVPKDLIQIAFDKGILSVKSVRRANRPESWRPVHRELADVDYALQLRLTGPVDEEKLSATSSDGILTITLPVRESAKPRLIAVN